MQAKNEARRAWEEVERRRNARRSIRDHAIPVINHDHEGTSVPPPVAANNFKLKPTFITLVSQEQFGGGPTEDPHNHLDNFTILCNFVNNFYQESIQLRFFLLSKG